MYSVRSTVPVLVTEVPSTVRYDGTVYDVRTTVRTVPYDCVIVYTTYGTTVRSYGTGTVPLRPVLFSRESWKIPREIQMALVLQFLIVVPSAYGGILFGSSACRPRHATVRCSASGARLDNVAQFFSPSSLREGIELQKELARIAAKQDPRVVLRRSLDLARALNTVGNEVLPSSEQRCSCNWFATHFSRAAHKALARSREATATATGTAVHLKADV